MTKLLTRQTSLALVFGLFFIASCSNLSKTESPADSSTNNSPLAELEKIDREIENKGSSESLLLRKTALFTELARNEPLPSSRKPLYRNARNSSAEGISRFGDSQEEFNNILSEAWSFEHNSGVQLLQSNQDFNRDQLSFEKATAHLENAIVLQPDSLLSYNILATALYSNGLYKDADAVLNDVLEIDRDPERAASVKEKQAFIYLESGDTDKAVEKYQSLFDENRSSITIRHGLVNAYILNNQHKEAVRLLEELTDEYPDQFSYKESLASAKYQLFINRSDSLLAGNVKTEDLDEEIEVLISHLSEINDIYDNESESSQMNEERVHTAAAFHTNGAGTIYDIRNNLELSEPQTEKLVKIENEFLETSLRYWEQLADLYPDNVEYLYTLYTVYNSLEMFEKAEQIEQSFNF